MRFGDISAAKSIANALVAQNGVQATLLAQHGITGPLDLFENTRGMGVVFSQGDAAAALTAPWPGRSTIMAANVKAFPCLATGQSVAAAGIAPARTAQGRHRGPQGVHAHHPGHAGAAPSEGRPEPHRAGSREADDHSFNFIAAVSLIDGEFGLAQFEHNRWADPQVCALMAQLEIIPDAAWNTRAPDSFPCSLAVATADGTEHRVEIPYPPGFSRGGLDADAVVKKFHGLAASHLRGVARERIEAAVVELDESPSCAELAASLAVGPAG